MRRSLPFFINLLTKNIRLFSTGLLVLAILSISGISRAQIYYTNSAGSTTTSIDVNDALKRINYDGTGNTTIIGSLVTVPTSTAIDWNGNRAFVYDNNTGIKQIKVINITSGAVTATITVPDALTAMRYDAASNYIYYLTTSGSNALASNDALRKVQPIGATGTNDQLVVGSITTTPGAFALDLPHNTVYVLDKFISTNVIKKVSLVSPNTTVTVLTQTKAIFGLDYNPADGNIYFLQSDGAGYKSKSADDAVLKISGDAVSGTPTPVATSIGNQPSVFALDAGNDRAFFYDGSTATDALARDIRLITLSTGLVNSTSVLSLALGNSITALNVPQPAIITTTTAGTITSASAILGGNISGSDLSVTERGVIYSSSSATPVIGAGGVTKSSNGSNTGSFSAAISGLSGSTTYYVRAYATSGAGTGYGNVVSFTTQSNDATLSGLTISAGTLNPAFASATTSYTATVANTNSTVTITPTRNNAGAGIQVNNVAATSGSGSSVNLSIGDNAIPVKVTAADGSTTKTYTITVNRPKAAQSITFNTLPAKTYGDGDFAPGATATSGLTVNYSSDNTNVATIVSGQIHIVGAGTVNITASQTGDGNTLAATSMVQSLTVNKAPQTITFNALPAKVYGNADFSPGATVSSGLTVSYASDNLSVATIVNNQVHIVGQGTANITASQAGDANRLPAISVAQYFTVDKATITVTAAAKTKIYGDADPAFTYTATGIFNSDAPTGALSRATPNTNRFIGSYAIEQGTLSYGSNYNINYVSANLTINKRPLSISPLPVTKQYGDADFAMGAPYSLNGTTLPPEDGMSGLFGRNSASENVGTYALTLGLKHPVDASNGQDRSANYDISFTTNTFTITPKPVNVTAFAQTRAYGDADPELSYTNSGLAFSDTFAGTLSRDAGEHIGTYAINQGTLALGSNYTLNFNSANLTINKKTINVTANAQSKNYSDADPALTYSNDPLALGDSFIGALQRDPGEDIGTYAISQGTLALNGNYNLSFTTANLSINKKTVNVTAEAKTKTYGETDPELTFTNDAALTNSAFSGSPERLYGENSGSHPISQGSLDLNNNYIINFIGADLFINKADLIFYALGKDVAFGDPDQPIGYFTSTVPVAGDTFVGELGRMPGAAIGTYAITQNSLSVTNSQNYNISFNSASYNIVPRPVSVSADVVYKNYGDPDPALTYHIFAGSLLPGDAITGSLVRETGETAGIHSINQGTVTLDNPNYNFTFQPGYIEIDRVPLTVKLDDKTKLFGQPNPPFTYTITGFKNGDTEASLLQPIFATANFYEWSPVGDYIISAYNGYSPNYDINYVDGVLTVRNAATNASLTGLSVDGHTISPAFDAETLNYTVAVGRDEQVVNIAGVLSDSNAKLFRINGFNAVSGVANNVSVYPGETPVSILVIAEDNSTTKEYILTVNRPLETDATLSSLSISQGTLNNAFNPALFNYTATVSNAVESFVLSQRAHSIYGLVKVNGVQPDGRPTRSLAVGENVFNIEVFAQDRSVSKIYKVVITREAPSNNATLASLKLNPNAVLVVAEKGTTNYTASVDEGTTSITVIPTTQNAFATIKVNGIAVASGAASGPVTLNVGQTVINTVVTSQDGTTISTYKVTVIRNGSNNATLASLKLNPNAPLVLVAKGTTNYTTSVDAATTNVTLTPTALDANATITVNGNPVASGTASAPVTLGLGQTVINTVVTAQDGTTISTYKVTVTRNGSNNTTLASLKLDPNTTLVPVTKGSTNYTASVDAATASVTVTAVTQDLNATVKINGITVASGSTSDPIVLSVGQTVINTVVTAQDGTTTATYSITVTRNGSNNAILASLKLNPNAVLVPVAKGSTNYTASVDVATTQASVTAVAQDPNAIITVDGVIVPGGTASADRTLNIGQTVFNVVVIAQDGTTVNSYKITVTRNGSNNATLASLKLSPDALLTPVVKGSTDYTASVDVATTSIIVTPTAQDENATITVNGTTVTSGMPAPAITLGLGQTVINTIVTAQDGTTTARYNVTVTRNGSNNATLTSLKLNPDALLTPVVKGSTNYTASVDPATTSIIVTPTAQDENATITVNNIPVTSGTASDPIALSLGQTTINTVVTAQDGTTIKTYSITVTRNGANNAILTTLKLTPNATLLAVEGPATKNYTASVDIATTDIRVTAVAQEPNATITVNGTPLTSGATSDLITLNIGQTVINTVVTAQDGTTIKTYSITVTRNGSNNAILTGLRLNPNAVLVPEATGSTNYTTSVDLATTNVTVIPTAQDANATIRVDGAVVSSGAASAPVTLGLGQTVINTIVTAQDGTTIKTYTITITRNGSNNATLKDLKIKPNTPLVLVAKGTTNYTAFVGTATASINILAGTMDASATITVNGNPVTSGALSGPIALHYGDNIINVIVTAQDGTTTKTYAIIVTRQPEAAGRFASVINDNMIAFGGDEVNATLLNAAKRDAIKSPAVEELTIPNGISPNGDGANDYLVINGITQYPDNKLSIMTKTGSTVFQATGYNNTEHTFDGSSPNGDRLPVGTYFYRLQYKDGKQVKTKAGFVMVEY